MFHSSSRKIVANSNMDTTNINERLKVVAQVGDINLLYTLIQENPYILDNIDSIPFVETPLHVAASFGQLQFATEVMRLKPSFAWKLNQQGFSPIHLAMQRGQWRMVDRLVDINNDLVRVKGREGLTPLHLASQIGEADLLAGFLSACPNSIEDVTVRSETALHIAVKSKKYEALQVLVGWLKINRQKDAIHLEKTILNWKDEAGNTILHVSALNNFSQALRLLVKTMRMNLNAKNLESSTALDIASSAEIRRILRTSGAKYGSSVTGAPSVADMLRSNIPGVGQTTIIPFLRLRSEISEEQRHAFLVVAALIATAAFQIALSPPGGVYQASIGDIINNNTNVNTITTSPINSTATATTPQGIVGKSVMSQADFDLLSTVGLISLVFSTVTIYFLTPGGIVGSLLFVPILLFLCCYIFSLKAVSPDKDASPAAFYLALTTSFFSLLGLHLLFHVFYKRLQYQTINWEAKTRNRTRGKRW